MVIELQNKLDGFRTSSKSIKEKEDSIKEIVDKEISNEVHSALINLGYKESEVNNAFAKLKLESYGKSDELQRSNIRKKLDFDELFKETLLRINTEARNKAT